MNLVHFESVYRSSICIMEVPVSVNLVILSLIFVKVNEHTHFSEYVSTL